MTQETPGAGGPLSAVQAASIVSAAIHPAIGVARIGNSALQIFLGPDVDEPSAEPPGAYRDANSALKRQAARFRIYGYDSAGQVVAELTLAQAAITWSVHLANGKAGWYQFNLALDITEAASTASARRNPSVTGAARAGLVIDGGLQSVSGASTVGPTFLGQVMGQSVTLGELATDNAGRLLVVGGRGVSASFNGSPITHYANNDGWYDDTSDGPVTANVSIGGRTVPVAPAWVVVAPPDYAPNLKSVRTMFDMVRDVFIASGALPAPLTSFTRDILPIFQRMSALQWTNFGFFRAFGHGAPLDFGSAAFLGSAAPLLAAGDPAMEGRRQLANAFRVFDRDGASPVPLPWIYGDAPSASPPFATHSNSALAPTQMQAIVDWAASTYVADYDPAAQPPRTIDAVPLADQPAMLDRAALSFLPGGRVPSGLRDHLADAAGLDVFGAVPDCACPAGDAAAGLWPRPDARDRADRGGAAGAARAGRSDTVDGRAVADGHGKLPVRLRCGVRSLSPHVLAGAGAQPCTGPSELPDGDGQSRAA